MINPCDFCTSDPASRPQLCEEKCYHWKLMNENERLKDPRRYDQLVDEASKAKRISWLLADAAVGLAEAVEAAMPGIRDVRDSAVMKAWNRMISAQREVMKYKGPEALADWDGGVYGEWFRLLELQQEENDQIKDDNKHLLIERQNLIVWLVEHPKVMEQIPIKYLDGSMDAVAEKFLKKEQGDD
jgi:hypothetical protein